MRNKKLKVLIIGGLALTLTTSNPLGIRVHGYKINPLQEVKKSKISVETIQLQSNKERYLKFEQQAKIVQQQRIEEERRQAELEAQRQAELEAERLRLEEERRIANINRANSVSFNSYNVLEPSYITAEELYQVFMYMDKPEMAELSWIISECEEITKINSFIISSIIANESAYGTSDRAIYSKNYTGYGVYTDDSTGINHGSAYTNIVNTFSDVRENYLTEGAIYHYGYSIYDINIKYSADPKWADKAINIASRMLDLYHTYVKNV